MAIGKSAIWAMADALKDDSGRAQQTSLATVNRIDGEGRIWVTLPGSADETPTETANAEVSRGDTVTVEWRGNKLHVLGNSSAPATSTPAVRRIVAPVVKMAQEAADGVSEAKDAAEAAETAASEAQAIAEAVDQHFWHRSTAPTPDDGAGTGAFVTDVTQEDFLAAAAGGWTDWDPDPESADYKPYLNTLITSAGQLFRTAVNNLVSISKSAIAFFDGEGNAAANIVAQFGSDGSRIGKATAANVTTGSNGVVVNNEQGLEVAQLGIEVITDVPLDTGVNGVDGLDVIGGISSSMIDTSIVDTEILRAEGVILPPSGTLRLSDDTFDGYSEQGFPTHETSWPYTEALFSLVAPPIHVSDVSNDGLHIVINGSGISDDSAEYRLSRSGIVRVNKSLTLSANGTDWVFNDSGTGLTTPSSVNNVIDVPRTYDKADSAASTNTTTNMTRVVDADGEVVGYVSHFFNTGGNMGTNIGVQRTINGSNVDNYIRAGINSSGGLYYGVADQDAFRSAIGITETTITTISQVLTAGSGVTINNARLHRQGDWVEVHIQVKRSSATAAMGTFTLGTIVSAYRPKALVGGNTAHWLGQINTGGVITVRNLSNGQVAANANIDISFSYSIA